LIGQDASSSLLIITALSAPSGTSQLLNTDGTPGGVNITTTNVNAIPLGQGNTLRGFTVGNVGTGIKITGTSFGTLIVGNSTSPDVVLSGTGQALSLTTGTLSVTGGFFSVASTSSSAQGINLVSVADSDGPGLLSFLFGSTTISGSANDAISVGSSTADLNFGNTSIGTASASSGGSDGVQLTSNTAGTRTFGTL